MLQKSKQQRPSHVYNETSRKRGPGRVHKQGPGTGKGKLLKGVTMAPAGKGNWKLHMRETEEADRQINFRAGG